MPQLRVPAVYLRGGTSRGLFFRREHLPSDEADWDAVFLAALGSPDPNARQLDGLGGGISSLSKVVVVEPSSRDDADIDYTFGQVAVDRPLVEYGNNCGNLTSAVGPFALDEGLVTGSGETASIRLFNRNTAKHVIATVPLDGAEAAVEGDLEIQGVAGRGAAIRLEFVDPGGAVTGSLLPTSALRDTLDVDGLGPVDVSIVDATAAVAFVRTEAVGLRGDESPQQLETNLDAMAALEEIRRCAAVHMGLTQSAEDAGRSLNRPFIALVAPPRDARTLAGEVIPAASVDLVARALSMGRPHRALPLTAALCLAAAARIEGTLVHDLTRPPASPNDDLRIGHPSGALPVAARVRRDGERWIVDGVVAYRTSRRLMEGSVLLPPSRVDGGALP